MAGSQAEDVAIGIPEAAALWRRDGWTVVRRLVPTAETDPAVEDAKALFAAPSKAMTSDDSLFESRRQDYGFRLEQYGGMVRFPFSGAPLLNRLVVHPNIRAFARAALGAADIRIHQCRLWIKRRGETNFDQPLHRDLNHALVPTHPHPRWWYLEAFLYLTDVDETTGPTMLVKNGPRGGPRQVQPADAPELYAAELPAIGERGSLLAYRPDTWHRASDFRPDGDLRAVLVLAFRRAAHDWVGYDSFPPLTVDASFKTFVAQSTPEDLALFGVPRPGHDFWTAELLDEMSERYPGLDTSPWRRALGGGNASGD